MLTRIKKRINAQLLSGVALIGIMVASLSVETACIFFLNQPKVPEKLRKNG